MCHSIHAFKKDYESQTSQCSQWGVEVQPYPNLQKKNGKFKRKGETAATPVLMYHPDSKPKNRPRRNLEPLNPTPDRRRLAKPRKINIQRIQLICKRSPTPHQQSRINTIL